MKTREKLVTEASRLLDAGGEAAVTLRAVGHAVGVSHNAPYRHFKDRSALLAGVAERDLTMLAGIFAQARTREGAPLDRLMAGLHAFVDYGRRHPNRYRLLQRPRHRRSGRTDRDGGIWRFCGCRRFGERGSGRGSPADEPIRCGSRADLCDGARRD